MSIPAAQEHSRPGGDHPVRCGWCTRVSARRGRDGDHLVL